LPFIAKKEGRGDDSKEKPLHSPAGGRNGKTRRVMVTKGTQLMKGEKKKRGDQGKL